MSCPCPRLFHYVCVLDGTLVMAAASENHGECTHH